MAPDQRTFVRAALDQLHLTPTELGTKLGKDNAYSAVNSWTTANPKNYRRLSFDDAMRIAEMCGWLTLAAPTVDPEATLPEAHEAGVDLILEGQLKMSEEVGKRMREVLAAIEMLRSHLDDVPSAGRSFPRRRQGNQSR